MREATADAEAETDGYHIKPTANKVGDSLLSSLAMSRLSSHEDTLRLPRTLCEILRRVKEKTHGVWRET